MATANEDGEEVQHVDAAVDENEIIKQWTIFVGGLFAAAGLGFGLLWFVLDALDQELLSADESGFGASVGGAIFELIFTIPGFLAVSLSAFVGAAIALKATDADETVFKIVGASVLVGTVLSWVLGVFIGVAAIDGLSAEAGGLVQNAIGAGIVAAVMGVLGAWLARNQSPGAAIDASGSSGEVAAPTDD